METKYLKKYAPEARREFITAVKNKAAVYGLLPKQILPMKEEGDVVIIGDRPFPRSVAKQRKELEDRIKKEGFQQFIEAVAYTWFNRFVAIRYMELHGYLDHGYRVLSHPEGKATPEILENAERIELAGLNRDEVVDLKLDGSKDEQLYQKLLLAQCNALHKAMPFLFESIKDGTELLLPDNLLHTDSLVRTLVNDIPEEQWENVEIIGWLYQFYISEKKDEVIGKVVKSEDIPAATQLFTPNWIVKYLVQNTLGRQWMATYRDSPLKQQMEFYIEPAEQTPEVRQQLDELTPDSLNPEELTLLDPACGSGHILVEAYDLFKAIYTERGYRARDIPKLILTKNLHGLEIDDRAAQLSAFALMMKARADDRSTFERDDVQPHVLSIQESKGLNAKEITEALNAALSDGSIGKVIQADIAHLIDIFENGKTAGSLISVTDSVAERLSDLLKRVEDVVSIGGMFEKAIARQFRPIVAQACLLASNFDAVATNPPYMGMGAMNKSLKAFILKSYEEAKIDIYAAFILRNLDFAKDGGYASLVTMHSWLFVFRFESLRKTLLNEYTLSSLLHLGPHAFPEITGQVVQVCAFTFRNQSNPNFVPVFHRLLSGDHRDKEQAVRNGRGRVERFSQKTFLRTPGTTMAYWAGPKTMKHLTENPLLDSVASPRHGMVTSDNDRFVRLWQEVSESKIGRGFATRESAAVSRKKWFPYNKGGTPRRWYGNTQYVVNWENDGEEIIAKARELYGSPSRKIQSPDFYFRSGLTWSSVTMKEIALRANGPGFLFDSGGSSMFFQRNDDTGYYLGLLNCVVARHYMRILSPTINVNAGDLARIPLVDAVDKPAKHGIATLADQAVELMRLEYSFYEEHWEFQELGAIKYRKGTISESLQQWQNESENKAKELSESEDRIDQEFVALYGLSEELDITSSEENPVQWGYSSGDTKSECERLVSYSIGCMMGRYSLDEPGLIYAHSGNDGFDSSRYSRFHADDDGIVPITDAAWFQDDAAKRFEEFIKTAWPQQQLEENLTLVAESLGQKKGETSRDCIRRYFATGFYKNHLSMYKKRPIYWLFSSGKQRAFQCLVYLHRYNAGTLSRMRTEYVVPLQGKMNARIEQLESDIPAANSTSHRKKLEKERDTLIKQREELQSFDEKLRHYADQRIELDLDDGVKVNYGKFGDLLAEVKAITGGKGDE